MSIVKSLITIGLASSVWTLAAARVNAEPVISNGVAVAVGGGVGGFTDKGMRDTTSTAGNWDLLAQFGTRSWLSIEGEYLGSASSVDALVGTKNANLVGTAIGADLRINALPSDKWQPYAFVGGAYRRYDITGAEFTTSDTGMNDTDTLFEVPMGAGVSYRDQGFVIDVRGTFRAAVDSQLVQESSASKDYLPMHNWGASARVGWEF